MTLTKCFAEGFNCRLEEGVETLPRLKIEASVVLYEKESVTTIQSDNIKCALVTACEKYITQKEGGAK